MFARVGAAEDHIHMGARKTEAVTVSGGHGLPFPTFRRFEEFAPGGGGVGDGDRAAFGIDRENIPLGAGVGGVVAEHQQVERRIERQFGGSGAVVDRGANGADQPFFLELDQLSLDAFG